MAEREHGKVTTTYKSNSVVTVRCGPCVQHLGRSAPALAVVDMSAGPGDDRILRIRRISASQRDTIRAAAETDNQRVKQRLDEWGLGVEQIAELDLEQHEELSSSEPPDEAADRAPWVSIAWVDRVRGRFVHPKGVELPCPRRRCTNRPRIRVRALLERAEKAHAEGRAEVYL
jgi:hypothetical protein